MIDSMTPRIEMTEHGAYAECDFAPMIDRIAEQVQWRVDHAALEQVAGELEKHGYVKVVRCRDCVYETRFSHHDDERWQCAEPHQEGDDVKPDAYCWRGRRKEGGE